jgi:hypothetical protein
MLYSEDHLLVSLNEDLVFLNSHSRADAIEMSVTASVMSHVLHSHVKQTSEEMTTNKNKARV